MPGVLTIFVGGSKALEVLKTVFEGDPGYIRVCNSRKGNIHLNNSIGGPDHTQRIDIYGLGQPFGLIRK